MRFYDDEKYQMIYDECLSDERMPRDPDIIDEDEDEEEGFVE